MVNVGRQGLICHCQNWLLRENSWKMVVIASVPSTALPEMNLKGKNWNWKFFDLSTAMLCKLWIWNYLYMETIYKCRNEMHAEASHDSIEWEFADWLGRRIKRTFCTECWKYVNLEFTVHRSMPALVFLMTAVGPFEAVSLLNQSQPFFSQ